MLRKTPCLRMPASHPASLFSQLSQIPLFDGLAPQEIERFAQRATQHKVDKGEILFHKGDSSTGFYLVREGQIKLALSTAEGCEKVVAIIHPGETFGEAIMLMDKPHIVFAQALAPTLLVHLDKKTIFEALDKDPELARRMLAGMAMRVHQLMHDLASYTLQNGRQRVIAYLLRELKQQNPGEHPINTLRLGAIKGVIASRLNLTQEHFSRILNELSQEGLIAVKGKLIEIPSVSKLREEEE